MGFHAGFITAGNEQISMAVVSDPSVGSDQHSWEFEEEQDRCAVCGGLRFNRVESSQLSCHTEETYEHLCLSQPEC